MNVTIWTTTSGRHPDRVREIILSKLFSWRTVRFGIQQVSWHRQLSPTVDEESPDNKIILSKLFSWMTAQHLCLTVKFLMLKFLNAIARLKIRYYFCIKKFHFKNYRYEYLTVSSRRVERLAAYGFVWNRIRIVHHLLWRSVCCRSLGCKVYPGNL